MRLKVTLSPKVHDKQCLPACTWTPENELLTCGDDKTIGKWDVDGESVGKLMDLPAYATDMQWAPSSGAQQSETFVLACTDGTLRLASKHGREEKKVEASPAGAIISVRWSHDGSAMVSGGEDGAVKIWSRLGMLRSTLATNTNPVNSVAWGPDSEQVLYTVGKDIRIKALQLDKKPLSWKAHDGVVLTVDWNPISGMIVSGGEDCKYKVWDSFGRILYQSSPFRHVITTVSWSPTGDFFAVGAYNVLRLCDATGWSYSRDSVPAGSILSMAWSHDGTQFAAAGAGGTLVKAEIVGATLNWGSLELVQTEATHIVVKDSLNETTEELDFREKVVAMSMAHGYLVVATTRQCHVYTVGNWNTPHILDLRSTVSMVVQSPTHFALIDRVSGLQLYTYDGRSAAAPKFPGMRPERLHRNSMSMAKDCIALIDDGAAANKSGAAGAATQPPRSTVRIFDVRSGRAVGTGVTHSSEIISVALNQFSKGFPDRVLAFIDAARDLYITPIMTARPVKLHNMVDSVCWDDNSDMLVACADGQIVTWTFPFMAFEDADLLPATQSTKDAPQIGKMPKILSVNANRVYFRKLDGAVVADTLAPYPRMLYDYSNTGQWDAALKLCRFVDASELWATLAGMGMRARNLDIVETALAALGHVDKVHSIIRIKNLTNPVARNAELALYRRSPEEAEQTLLQASPPLVYRAIKLNIRLFRWHRALEIAMQHRTHVDTVIAYRQRFFEAGNMVDDDAHFLRLADQVKISWDSIKAKIAEDKAAEAGGRRAAPASSNSSKFESAQSYQAAAPTPVAPPVHSGGAAMPISDDDDEGVEMHGDEPIEGDDVEDGF